VRALRDVFSNEACRGILQRLHKRYVDESKVLDIGGDDEPRAGAALLLEQVGLLHRTDPDGTTWELTAHGHKIAHHFISWCKAQEDETSGRVLFGAKSGKEVRVLDVGCGSGGMLYSIASREAAAFGVGLDLDSDVILLGKILQETLPARRGRTDARCALMTADAHTLPFRNGAFDVVLCRDNLQYLDIQVALSEMARTTRDGARFYFLVHAPGFYLDRMVHRGPATFKADGFALANAMMLHLLGRQLTLRGPSGRAVRTCALTRQRMERLLGRHGILIEECKVHGSRWGIPIFLEILARKSRQSRSRTPGQPAVHP
jgi:SAM-dependent methyltransferase